MVQESNNKIEMYGDLSMLSSLQVHANAERPLATIPSFLFALVGHLKEEDHPLLKPYAFKHLKNENREAYLLSFDIKVDTEVTRFFAREGYTLREDHLSIDRLHSNKFDWLSLAHRTLQYKNDQDETAIIVHVYFDKKIALWSVRAKKQLADGESSHDENLVLDAYQIKKMIGFSEGASLLLQDLLSEYAKRYADTLNKSESIEQELSGLSVHLKTKNERDVYRSKAAVFLESLVALGEHDDSRVSKARSFFVERMLALCDQADRLVPIPSAVHPVQRPQVLTSILDAGLEAESQSIPVLVPPTSQLLAAEQGQKLYANMQALSKKVEALLKASTQDFFKEFSVVDELRLVIAELTFFDAAWKKPKNLSKILKKLEKILTEAQSQRAMKVSDLFKDAHFESVQSALECLSEKEHASVMWSIFHYCASECLDKIGQNQINVLDWYFSNRYNFYQSYLKMLEVTFLDTPGLTLLPSFLLKIFAVQDLNFFKKLLEHGMNANGPGLKKDTLGKSFYPLLESILFHHSSTLPCEEYVNLLMQHGAFLDFRLPEDVLKYSIILKYQDVYVQRTVEDEQRIKKTITELSAPSDLWLVSYVGINNIPQIFIEGANLSALALGLGQFATLKYCNVNRLMGKVKVPGVGCYLSSEAFNSSRDREEIFSSGPIYNDRIRIYFVLSENFFPLASRFLNVFKERAQNLKAIDKAITHLRSLRHHENFEALEISIFYAIMFLIAERTFFEPLSMEDIDLFIFSAFRSRNKETDELKKLSFSRLLSGFTGSFPHLSEEIKKLVSYQVVERSLRKLEGRLQPPPLLLSAASQLAVAAVAASPGSSQVPATTVAVVQSQESSGRAKKSGKKIVK